MTRHIHKFYEVRTQVTKQKTEFIINFVKEKQDWKHKHRDVDSGYFRGCNGGAGIYIWQVIFFPFFLTYHVLIVLLGQKSIYFLCLNSSFKKWRLFVLYICIDLEKSLHRFIHQDFETD